MNLEIVDSIKQVAAAAEQSGRQAERVRCLLILEKVLKERPPSAPEALLRVGELIDAGD